MDLILVVSEKNLGLSHGMNRLNECTKPYKYVLMIEDDWYCLPKKITGINKSWLKTCIDFMEEKENSGV